VTPLPVPDGCIEQFGEGEAKMNAFCSSSRASGELAVLIVRETVFQAGA
jgi:hypothetical protein